jgi:hypothetical protein
MRLVVGSAIARRIRISRFDDENEASSGFEARRPLQKFSSVHAQVRDHFNQERHLVTRVARSRGLMTAWIWP